MEKSNKRRYTLIVISFLFLLVATFVTVYNFKDTRAELSLGFIEDENLRECISNTNVNSIDEITSLTCVNKNVESLVGLNNLSNLTELNLSHNNISDISALSGLNNLTELRLSYNNIIDISALSGLNNLTELYLSYNNIIDISALRRLNNLKTLDLSSNNISDISALSGLNNLMLLYLFNNNLKEKNGICGSFCSYGTQVIFNINDGTDDKLYQNRKNGVLKPDNPTRSGYIFDGWFKDASLSEDSEVNFDSESGLSTNVDFSVSPVTLYAKWKLSSTTTTTYSVKFNFNAPSNVSSANCICDGLDEICRAFDSNPTEIFDYVVSAGSSIQLPTISCPGINKKIKDWSGNTGNFKPTANTILKANWGSINSGNTPSNDEYTVTLNRNCSGTFVCSSTTNSEVCTQLKNNGKFTKIVTKGDTFVFPKTFDKLTCDGKEISSWGSFDLGYELNVTSDVTASAKWKSSSGGGNTPSNDEYTVTLNRNCSGTFVCSSTTNSEVCTQLKNNGKFTKIVTKGDTFVFPKTFDKLTCDGKEISSWGSFDLGYELNVTSDVTASAKWKSSSGGGNTPSNDEYTVTLNRNCSGTFVCNSTTNSSVCEQLKNNGKFTKTVTKGDTFIFPKTFDTLTCDGKEISSWGSYSLGTNITVNKNIDIDAAWESSNGGGDTPDPSQNDDPIDNPQTGSIVIYLVLLFGIGALVYSVWYFRGFREN